MKIFIFSDTCWSLGRVHRGVMKQLNHDVRYVDWAKYSWNDFFTNYEWCDVCIANLVAYKALKPSFPMLNFNKCIFVSHGYPEHADITYDTSLTYGMTSEAIRTLFPSDITPFLMPNGVDPDDFNYLPKHGNIEKLGWCGADHVPSKQVGWAYEISKQTNLELKLATRLSYEEVKQWYNNIDLLLLTSIPTADRESGPLPPFEAIVSGVPVIGTPVGNFKNVPGPKFESVEQAVSMINYYRSSPEELKALAKQQYDYVINNYTFKVLAPYWEKAIISKNGNNQQ